MLRGIVFRGSLFIIFSACTFLDRGVTQCVQHTIIVFNNFYSYFMQFPGITSMPTLIKYKFLY